MTATDLDEVVAEQVEGGCFIACHQEVAERPLEVTGIDEERGGPLMEGPFAVRMWVHVNASGKADRTIPIQASDPVVLADARKQIAAWQFRPARANGQAVDSWNELMLSGQIGYSVDVKQIANLRKTLPDADAKH